jgi:hypothetical protein
LSVYSGKDGSGPAMAVSPDMLRLPFRLGFPLSRRLLRLYLRLRGRHFSRSDFVALLANTLAVFFSDAS